MARKKTSKKSDESVPVEEYAIRLNDIFEVVAGHPEGVTRSRVVAYKSYYLTEDQVNQAIDNLISTGRIEEWTTREIVLNIGQEEPYSEAFTSGIEQKTLKVVKQ